MRRVAAALFTLLIVVGMAAAGMAGFPWPR
jgi:hypothetical protein